MSKIIKKANELRKKSWNSTKKAFRKVASSTIGKIILVAAAIWLGGAALGAWNSGIGAVDGALVAGGSGGAATGATLAPGGGVLAPSAGGGAAAVIPASQTAGQALASSVMPSAVGGTGQSLAGSAAATQGASVAAAAPSATPTSGVMLPGGLGAASETGAAVAKKGLISKMMTPVGKMATWAADNPIPSMMIMNGIGNALSPDAIDLAKQQEEQDAETRRRWEENLQVGNVDLGFRSTRQPLLYQSGGEVYDPRTGAINRVSRV